ncbi:MAG: CBS domain-containing protein [bacterium]
MKTITARQIMNPDLMTVSENMTVEELAAFLTEEEITGAPVVNEKGKLVGVVSVNDIAENAAEERMFLQRPSEYYAKSHDEALNLKAVKSIKLKSEHKRVRDIMTPTVFTIPHDTPVPKIAKTLIASRIHRLLVTENEKVVGILTALDILKLLCD